MPQTLNNLRAFLIGCLLFFAPVPVGHAQTTAPPPEPTANTQSVVRQKLPDGITAVDPVWMDYLKDRFTPEAIAARELSAILGKVQTNEEWMWPGAAYQLLSPPRADGKPGGIKTRIAKPADLMGNNNISFYRLPWQAWEETVRWDRIRNGLGINLNVPQALLPSALKQIKAMGMGYVRRDIGWGNLWYEHPDKLKPDFEKELAVWLAACKTAGVRPLICLDTNPAAPCPINEAEVTLLAPLSAGDTSALVQPRRGEVPTARRSGFSHVTQYWAAEYLVTSVEAEGDSGTSGSASGYRVHFTKPWPKEKAAEVGAKLSYAYLAYRPFSNDNTPESERTLDGFARVFPQAVVSFLETQNLRKSKTDPGYDIEVINENSNGHFFHGEWYSDKLSSGSGSEVEVYKRIVKLLRSNPANDGMTLINGFYNQLAPGPGSREPPGSNGGSAHYYQGEQKIVAHTAFVEDAFARDTPNGYVPNVTLDAPEVVFSSVKVENLGRVIAPIPQQLWGPVFGRGVQPRAGNGSWADPIALEPTGKKARATRWYKTEWGSSVYGTDAEKQRLIAKFVLRGTVFALSKGIERIYWFAAIDPALGILSFSNDALPATETSTVILLRRLNALMQGNAITKPRHMPVVSIAETHGNVQFKGNGTIEFPDLPNRDLLFTQSFQLSDTDLMACVYVPTLNYKPDMPPESYTIRWSGVKWVEGTSKAAWRDLKDVQAKSVKPSEIGTSGDGTPWVEFTLPVTDWPRFLKLSGV